MSLSLFALALFAPSGAFALAAGDAPSLPPLLLALYWGLFPPLLYRAGGFLEGVFPFPRLPRLRGEAYAIALPYLLYWPAARRAGLSFGEAFLAFLRGPGTGGPLAAFLSLLLGRGLPPLAVTLAVLALSLLLERGIRRFAPR